MLLTTALAAAIFATSTSASMADMAAEGVRTGLSPDLERQMLGAVEQEFQPLAVIARRDTSGAIFNQDGTINMTAWDEQASAACRQALANLPQATNPSGTCTCYNLPALDNVTGAFEADLRLFQISTPTGEFTGIPPQNIEVGLSYSGASVSPVNAGTTGKEVVTKLAGRQAQDPANLKLLQTYLFVGQVDKAKMTPDMDMATLQALVMPVVTLSGVNAAGKTVSTNVSSNEAAFVAGAFSKAVVLSPTAKAQQAVDAQVALLHEDKVAFVLPGVQILIFPVGLVITSVWLVVGLAVIGFGFFERMSYREQYRRRAAKVSKGNFLKRI